MTSPGNQHTFVSHNRETCIGLRHAESPPIHAAKTAAKNIISLIALMLLMNLHSLSNSSKNCTKFLTLF